MSRADHEASVLMCAQVVSCRYTYQPIATCEGPDDWVFEHPDHRRMRREARKHAAQTGHRARIDWAWSTVYERRPGAPAG